MSRNTVRTSSCTMRTIEVPRIAEVRVPPELWMKVHPVIRVLCLVECETEHFQRSFDFIETPRRTTSTALSNWCSQAFSSATRSLLIRRHRHPKRNLLH